MERTVFWRTVTSTTFWFNIITFIIAALALPEVAALIPESWAKAMLVVNPLGNLIIRQFLTATPITRSAAERARIKAGMPKGKVVGNRWNDPVPLPEEVEATTEAKPVAPKRRKTDKAKPRRRKTDKTKKTVVTKLRPVGRTITETASVKPADKPFSVEGKDND